MVTAYSTNGREEGQIILLIHEMMMMMMKFDVSFRVFAVCKEVFPL
jgi:hypothetical protein